MCGFFLGTGYLLLATKENKLSFEFDFSISTRKMPSTKMCKDAKSSLIGWILGTVTGLLLWYRNHLYDRPLAGLIIVFSQIQLIEFGIWNHWQPNTAARMLPLALISQVIVFTGLVYLLTTGGHSLSDGFLTVGCHDHVNLLGGRKHLPQRSEVGRWLLTILFGMVIVAGGVLLYDNVYGATQYDVRVGPNGHLVWLRDGEPSILGWWGWVYLAGLLLPLLWLWYWSGYRQSLGWLLLFAIASLIWSWQRYHESGEFGSMWCYLAVGFGFLVWLVN